MICTGHAISFLSVTLTCMYAPWEWPAAVHSAPSSYEHHAAKIPQNQHGTEAVTRRFIAVITTARKWPLSGSHMNPIQSTPHVLCINTSSFLPKNAKTPYLLVYNKTTWYKKKDWVTCDTNVSARRQWAGCDKLTGLYGEFCKTCIYLLPSTSCQLAQR
jgi:hypothetical protein